VNIYEVITEYLGQGRCGILAMIIKRNGSAPRDIGAKMFIGEDGRTFGTVGGGQFESGTYNKSLEIMNKGLTNTFSISVDAQSVEENGGNVEVFLEPLTGKYLSVYQQIENCFKNREAGVVATRFGSAVFAKTLINEDLNTNGDALDTKTVNKCKDIFREKQPVFLDGMLLDPIRLSFPLYLFVAGHVSQCLSKIVKIVDFNITVIDDREEFETNPDAETLLKAAARSMA
jgi:xanthine dehydrogenase accessory factor